jgi:hypothetical protein
VSKRKTTAEFIVDCNQKHNFKYDYSMVEYVGSFSKVTIICPTHGKFQQTPHDHSTVRTPYPPRGCPSCANQARAAKTGPAKKFDITKFIKNATKVHGQLYDYSGSVYLGMNDPITIKCRIHGEFTQVAHVHTYGSGCPKCGLGNNSKPEKQWLDLHNVLEENRQYCIRVGGKRYFVDGYNPSTNTLYEFYGDFWHGNPKKFNGDKINSFTGKTFGELYQNTCEREQMLLQLGYKVVSIWESDFNITKGKLCS